jgi:hypothetical protein
MHEKKHNGTGWKVEIGRYLRVVLALVLALEAARAAFLIVGPRRTV